MSKTLESGLNARFVHNRITTSHNVAKKNLPNNEYHLSDPAYFYSSHVYGISPPHGIDRHDETALGGFDILHRNKVVGRVEYANLVDLSEKPVLHIEKAHAPVALAIALAFKQHAKWLMKPKIKTSKTVKPLEEHLKAKYPPHPEPEPRPKYLPRDEAKNLKMD
ncbi:MAG: hypothetical protein Q8R15_02320 [Candidatus Micrarchaeota archaeon]|nr:hypothetical protein [Candidatus Micrarchaeota archaeon]